MVAKILFIYSFLWVTFAVLYYTLFNLIVNGENPFIFDGLMLIPVELFLILVLIRHYKKK